MAKITIDGKEYDSEKLSDEVKSSITSIRITDLKIENLKQELAIAQTARNAYSKALLLQLNKKKESKKK